MVDDDPARLGSGVGIAAAGQAGDDPALGGNDIDRASRLARRQADFAVYRRAGFRVRSRVGPQDGGFGQVEPPAGLDIDDGDGVLVALDHILDG